MFYILYYFLKFMYVYPTTHRNSTASLFLICSIKELFIWLPQKLLDSMYIKILWKLLKISAICYTNAKKLKKNILLMKELLRF